MDVLQRLPGGGASFPLKLQLKGDLVRQTPVGQNGLQHTTGRVVSNSTLQVVSDLKCGRGISFKKLRRNIACGIGDEVTNGE